MLILVSNPNTLLTLHLYVLLNDHTGDLGLD